MMVAIGPRRNPTFYRVVGAYTWTGQKTVFFQAFNDTVSSPSPTHSKITFVVPPSALSITINGGVNQTRVNNVTLSLSATGATEMCFSNDGNAWSTWEPYNTSKSRNLTGDSGYKTVYFNTRNGTIQASSTAAASIMYSPVNLPSIWHPGNLIVYTNQSNPTINWQISGGSSSGNTATIYQNGTAVSWDRGLRVLRFLILSTMQTRVPTILLL